MIIDIFISNIENIKLHSVNKIINQITIIDFGEIHEKHNINTHNAYQFAF